VDHDDLWNKTMKCSDVLEALVEYLDKTMTLEAREEVDCHRAWCHNCEMLLSSCQMTIDLYQKNECVEVPDNFPSEHRTRFHNFLVAKRQSMNKP
jgi:hypothetical protein